MANRDKRRQLTRKQHSRLEKERNQRRIVQISTIAVVSIVVIIIVIGFVREMFIKPQQPIARVGDTTITTGEFQSYTRYQRFRLVNEYLSTYQFIQGLGDPNSASYFESYLLQIQSELEPEILGLNVINQMVDNEIIKKEAEALGITVSEDEVEESIQESIFQYYPEGSPTPEPTSPVLPSPTLSEIQLTLVPPTPTMIATDLASEGSEGDDTGDTTDQIEDEGDSATPTPLPTAAAPTPTVYTEKAYNQNYEDYIGYLSSYARVDVEVIYKFFESAILRERVAEAVITDLPQAEEKLWARHILFRDEETGQAQAEAFLTRINAGEDFVEVGEELSANAATNEETGSTTIFEDLGWFGEGMMVQAFEEAAQVLEIGEISEPIQTSFGWHVIQLLGHDTQPRSQSNLDQLESEAFQAWIAEKRLEYQVDITQDWFAVVPTEPEIPVQARISPVE